MRRKVQSADFIVWKAVTPGDAFCQTALCADLARVLSHCAQVGGAGLPASWLFSHESSSWRSLAVSVVLAASAKLPLTSPALIHLV